MAEVALGAAKRAMRRVTEGIFSIRLEEGLFKNHLVRGETESPGGDGDWPRKLVAGTRTAGFWLCVPDLLHLGF